MSHLELYRIDLSKLTSSILMEVVAIPIVLVGESYFYMHHPIKASLLKNYLWTSLLFSYSLKITCILLIQVISLKETVVLSVKLIVLISWSPFCISLTLLSALMGLAQYCITAWDSCRHWRTHIRVHCTINHISQVLEYHGKLKKTK